MLARSHGQLFESPTRGRDEERWLRAIIEVRKMLCIGAPNSAAEVSGSTNAMAEEDPFTELKNSSALHAAIITSDGALILTPRFSGDEQSLIDFQSIALEALEIAAENNRHVSEHLVPARRGGRLYDRIVIHP